MTWNNFLCAIGVLPYKKKSDKKSDKKEFTPEQFVKIKEEYQILKKRVGDESQKSYEDARKRLTVENDVCPKCKSINVNDRIQRLQGEFSGSVSGSSSFFGGSMFGHSSGSIDTNEVNKCNDCGHEWKKYKMSYLFSSDLMNLYFSRLNYRMEEFYKAKTATINKEDLNEKYTSDKEKQEALLATLITSYQLRTIKEVFTGISIETIYEVAKKEIYNTTYNCGRFDDFIKFWDESFLMNFVDLKHIQI